MNLGGVPDKGGIGHGDLAAVFRRESAPFVGGIVFERAAFNFDRAAPQTAVDRTAVPFGRGVVPEDDIGDIERVGDNRAAVVGRRIVAENRVDHFQRVGKDRAAAAAGRLRGISADQGVFRNARKWEIFLIIILVDIIARIVLEIFTQVGIIAIFCQFTDQEIFIFAGVVIVAKDVVSVIVIFILIFTGNNDSDPGCLIAVKRRVSHIDRRAVNRAAVAVRFVRGEISIGNC